MQCKIKDKTIIEFIKIRHNYEKKIILLSLNPRHIIEIFYEINSRCLIILNSNIFM